MSTGRAIVTTDAPGCRETVIPGANGFLVPVGDAAALAAAMERLIVEPGLARTFGTRSRALAEKRFDVRRINAEMLRAMGLA
jgi:glycosyltransferase involved in cell wall biosynthesis